MSEKNTLEKKVKLLMKDLRLSAMKNYYKDAVNRATQNEHSYEEFLLELLQFEHDQRFNNRIARLLKESKVSVQSI